MCPVPEKPSDSIDFDDFDSFVQNLQEEIDQKDQKEFSSYALALANDLQYIGTIARSSGNSQSLVIHEWQGPCGDSVKWYLLIKNHRLSQVRYQTNGCTTSDIASEQTARLVDQKSISEVRKLTAADVLKSLQKFPVESHHCAELAVKSLHFTLDKFDQHNEL